ncbi:MAG: hypothetical protein GY833_06180 [Aestuariibacter sp.]|nr:hypothetical protein [Aestuariibacter sp.]
MGNFKWSWRWALLLTLLAILSLYACFQRFCSIKDKNPFIGESLDIPRWHGIVLGETSKEGVLEILRSSPYVRRASILTMSDERLDGTIIELVRWDNRVLSLIPSTYAPNNEIRIIEDKVREIRIHMEYDVTIEQIIALVGEPKKVEREITHNLQGGRYSAFYLLFSSQGLIVDGVATLDGLITPNSRVIRVYYFEPASLDESNNTIESLPHWDLSDMEDWTGYDSTQIP